MKSKSEIDAIVDRWCDALESGKYQQDKQYLNRDGKFCCLGVLLDVLRDEYPLRISMDGDIVLYNGEDTWLPALIANDLGIDGLGEFYGTAYGVEYPVSVEFPGGAFDGLARANEEGAPFPEIAAAIRANKALLFKAYREGVQS